MSLPTHPPTVFPKKSSRKPSPVAFDLDAYRKRAEKSFTEINAEKFNIHGGLSDGSAMSSVVEKYADLNAADVKEALGMLLKKAKNDRDRRQLQILYQAAVIGKLDDAIGVKMTQAQVLSQNEPITLKDPETQQDITITPSTAYAISVSDPARDNRELATKLLSKFRRDKLNPIYEEIHHALHQFPKPNGYKSFIQMMELYRGYSFDDITKAVRHFLRETDDLYRDSLKYFLKTKLGLPLNKARYHDVAILFRAAEFDPLFPKETMLDTIFGFIRQMGLDPAAKGHIHIDLESRPNKNPRPMVYPIKIPSRIAINISPRGGAGDYYAVLEEMGHALHFAYTSPRVPFEFRYPIENSLTESYSYTIAKLMLNPLWLMKVMKIADPDPFLRHKAFLDLFMTRRYFAKFLYELRLHKSGSVQGKAEAYQEILGKVLMLPIVKENYLADVDPFFTVNSYVQAFLAQAEIHSKLRSSFGDDWFLNPKTGAFLKDLWSTGNEMTVAELGDRLGFDGLSAKPLIKLYRSLLDDNLRLL